MLKIINNQFFNIYFIHKEQTLGLDYSDCKLLNNI
jgi:hypothetical protein